jgi:ABC-2 type transport system ATP-binding protein
MIGTVHATVSAAPPAPLAGGVPLTLNAGTYEIAGGFRLATDRVTIVPGRVYALVGPNGAGKTSLLRLLSGEHAAGSDHVRFEGDPPVLLRDMPQSNAVGVVTHAPGPWSLRLFDRLCLDAALVGSTPRNAELLATQWIAHLGLEDIANKTWKAMSAGFRMRAAIARQMVQGPPVLLLDEPLGPLDLATQRRVLNDLKQIATRAPHGVAVVLSSQHLAEVETVADNLIIVEKGVITYAGARNAFGVNFTTTIFELNALDPHMLQQCLTALGGTILRADASGVRVEFGASMSTLQLMAGLVEHRIEVSGLRELTNSSARLL